MKFIISRESHLGKGHDVVGVPPCEGAKQEGGQWIIEINSLEDLSQFIDNNGPIKLSRWYTWPELDITICDDNR